LASVRVQRGVAVRIVVLVGGARPGVPLGAPLDGARVERIVEDLPPGRALRVARGLVAAPCYAFLDDDDELLPDALATRLRALREHPPAHVVVTTGRSISRGR